MVRMTDNRPAFVSGLVGHYPARLLFEGECPGRRRSLQPHLETDELQDGSHYKRGGSKIMRSNCSYYRVC
jgi:hypothetical protein